MFNTITVSTLFESNKCSLGKHKRLLSQNWKILQTPDFWTIVSMTIGIKHKCFLITQEEMTNALATIRVDYEQIKIKPIKDASNPLLLKRRNKMAAAMEEGPWQINASGNGQSSWSLQKSSDDLTIGDGETTCGLSWHLVFISVFKACTSYSINICVNICKDVWGVSHLPSQLYL